jgi:hypothetical protein
MADKKTAAHVLLEYGEYPSLGLDVDLRSRQHFEIPFTDCTLRNVSTLPPAELQSRAKHLIPQGKAPTGDVRLQIRAPPVK